MDYLFILGAKYLYLVIIVIAIIYFIREKKGIQKQIVTVGSIILSLSYVIAKISSFLFYNPRPFVVEKITPLVFHIADNGFPSDHTLLSSSVAFIIFSFNKKLGIILIVLTLLVGLSRVYVGIHHFIDIIGSVIIAGIVTALVCSFFKKKLIKNDSRQS